MPRTLRAADRDQVTSAARTINFLAGGAGQASSHQIVVKGLESRVFDDGEHIDQAPWLQPGFNPLTVFALDFVKLSIAPHQAQASSDGLFKQNLRL